MDLYDTDTANQDILTNKSLRYIKFCLDFDFLSKMKKEYSFPELNNLSWKDVQFDKTSKSMVPESSGIYLFGLQPYSSTHLEKGIISNFIMYIGQAKNLRERFSSYFYYPKHRNLKIADIGKRRMIGIWQEHLRFFFYEIKDSSKSNITDIEYALIDSILPPFNDRFRADISKANKKFYM